MKTKIYIILLLLMCYLYAFADYQYGFSWKCNSKDKCNLYANFKNKKPLLIYEDFDKWEMGTAAYNIYQNGLVKVSFPCGSPCTYSTYINFKTEQISPSYFLVLATDPKKLLIALPDPDDSDDNTLEIKPIFDEHSDSIKIKRNFSSGVSISLEKAKFVEDKLDIEYQVGDQYIDKYESISLSQLKQN